MAAQTITGASWVARVQGSFYVASGLWPLLHRRSFEAVFGPKQDYWLATTVGLLLAGTGATQLTAPTTPDGLATVRRVGVSTAAALACVDVVNVSRRRIPATYLLDAAAELGWLWAWARSENARPRSAPPR